MRNDRNHSNNIKINFLQFIDLCILLGCDYCESIRGIGPKRAVELIKQHKSIEEIIKHIDTNKYIVPEDWSYAQARQLFITPDVADPDTVEVNDSLSLFPPFAFH